MNSTGLPHAARIPVLGDITSIDRRIPTQHEARLTDQLGAIYERKLLSTRFAVVGGGRLAAECNVETNWARALAGPTMLFRNIVASGLFTAKSSDPLWGQARRILDPGFTQAALKNYHAAMSSVADDLVGAWRRQGGVVDVHEAMTNATLEVIARAGFSQDLGLFTDEPMSDDIRSLLDTLGEVLAWASEASNDLPIIGPIRSARRQAGFARGLQAMKSYVDKIVAERVAAGDSRQTDLLGLMLETTDPETGDKLPHGNVRDQVLTFLIAGHETTAALLETTLWYLASMPDLAEQVRSEASQRGFDYSAVAGMKFTRSMLNETLRLWPPVPAYFRVARVDQNLGGYDLKAGQLVSVLVLAAQRDVDVWGPTAKEFDPNRWQPKTLREHPDRFFSPFGTGPRSCIGRAFAMQEAALMISKIVAAYDLSLVSPESGNEPTMLERGTLRPKPFQCQITPVNAAL